MERLCLQKLPADVENTTFITDVSGADTGWKMKYTVAGGWETSVQFSSPDYSQNFILERPEERPDSGALKRWFHAACSVACLLNSAAAKDFASEVKF